MIIQSDDDVDYDDEDDDDMYVWQEAQLARCEAERMASLAESCPQHPPVTMEPITKEMSVAKSSQPPKLLPNNRDSKR